MRRKKVSQLIILEAILLFSLVVPVGAFAGTGTVLENGDCTLIGGVDSCSSKLVCIGYVDSDQKGECLQELPNGPDTPGKMLDVIKNIGNWIFAFFLAVSVIFLVWGAFEFVLGQGAPERVSLAKKRLIYAVIGIALAMLAASVDDVLRNVLIDKVDVGGGDGGWGGDTD